MPLPSFRWRQQDLQVYRAVFFQHEPRDGGPRVFIQQPTVAGIRPTTPTATRSGGCTPRPPAWGVKQLQQGVASRGSPDAAGHKETLSAAPERQAASSEGARTIGKRLQEPQAGRCSAKDRAAEEAFCRRHETEGLRITVLADARGADVAPLRPDRHPATPGTVPGRLARRAASLATAPRVSSC
jgi:hypothetical protein